MDNLKAWAARFGEILFAGFALWILFLKFYEWRDSRRDEAVKRQWRQDQSC